MKTLDVLEEMWEVEALIKDTGGLYLSSYPLSSSS